MEDKVVVHDPEAHLSLTQMLEGKKRLVKVSYGGGTDSTALIIACKERNIPIDIILFSDTGGEKPHTYAFIETMQEWLAKNGMVPITILKRTNKAKEVVTLEQDCLNKGFLPSIAYGFKKCSLKYKVEPQEKYMNNWPPAKACWKSGDRPITLIGYNAGEARRAKIMSKDKYFYRYPLIEWGLTRAQCVESIVKAGLPLPGKSACFFCPNSKKDEIHDLKERYPSLLDRALHMEQHGLQKSTSVKGLGRRFNWGELVAEKKEAQEIAEFSDTEMPCGCYDGD